MKRCIKRKYKNLSKSIKVYAANAAGIKCKTKSLGQILSSLKPSLWMLQETKLKTNEKIKCEDINDYQVYYLNRQNSQGGGLALGVLKTIESALVRDGDDNLEVISINALLGEVSTRVIVGYGPQESDNIEKKKNFWNFIENEVYEAELQNQGIMLQMDGNLHAGELVKNDPNIQNKNGKMFMDFLERNNSLLVLNCMDTCKGVITRKRILENKVEEAVLDFFLINDTMRPFFKEMIIDEERNYCLSNIDQIKRNKRIIESDHNAMIGEFYLTISNRKPDRQEMLNLRNKDCQNAFKNMTEINLEFLNCFENDLPFQVQSKSWEKTFKSVLKKCFRKVRIVNSRKKGNEKMKNMISERIQMKQDLKSVKISEDMKIKIEVRIKQIEEDMENEVSEEYRNEVMETLRELSGSEDCVNGDRRKRMWKILKKNYPQDLNKIPMGKKDRKGNIITNHEGLKSLFLDTYVNRLRNRPMKPDLEELKELKEELFELRLGLSKMKQGSVWTIKHLDMAIKGLKKDKARDPGGLVNDIFKDGVAGKDFKLSLLKFFNKIREEDYIPDFVTLADVVTIYKGKGEKCDLKNDRGIFLVTIFRSILMRLIYLDKSKLLDHSMSDSQVGGRKGKSVRNHIWILNGIICDVLSKKNKTPIDLGIYDYRQCFDTLWVQECMNDLYKGGIKDDRFKLLYNINTKVDVAVKTPIGKTKRGVITNAIIQGDVFGPMFCAKQVDEIGKECMEMNKYTYRYKGEVDIPPLSMMDDLISISECGH